MKNRHYDILILGAGAAGIGFGIALKQTTSAQFLLLEQGQIGNSFLHWPEETRFITPSFTTNGFGFPDINAISPDSSPAFSIEKEHLSGTDYADYLEAAVEAYQLPVQTNVTVQHISQNQNGYSVQTTKGEYTATYIICALGEFNNPTTGSIEGSEHALHYGEIDAFHSLPNGAYAIIGGNESGIDSFNNLISLGNSVTLYTQESGLDANEADPSIRLAPVTREHFTTFTQQFTNFSIEKQKTLTAITKEEHTYHLHFQDGSSAEFECPPILATGFSSCVKQLSSRLFDYHENGKPVLSEHDESTICPNIFLVGPSVQHQDTIFCYIYKFRQRFIPIIRTIAQRAGWDLNTEILNVYQRNQMDLTNFDCCHVHCDC